MAAYVVYWGMQFLNTLNIAQILKNIYCRTFLFSSSDDFSKCITYKNNSCLSFYNQFHNISRLFDVLGNFPCTTSETMGDYYL